MFVPAQSYATDNLQLLQIDFVTAPANTKHKRLTCQCKIIQTGTVKTGVYSQDGTLLATSESVVQLATSQSAPVKINKLLTFCFLAKNLSLMQNFPHCSLSLSEQKMCDDTVRAGTRKCGHILTNVIIMKTFQA